jgi:HD-GYP domain-containing protein (c-di-GMP phosphodiesterase class II)
MMQNTFYLPNTYLSTFLAAKYLGISAFELSRLVMENKLQTYTVDRFGEKFLVRDLNRFKEQPQEANQTAGIQPQAPDSANTPQAAVRINYDEIISLHILTNERQEFFELPTHLVGSIATVPLFYKPAKDTYVIYKSAGTALTADRLAETKLPTLYIRKKDKTAGAIDIHLKLLTPLRQSINAEDCDRIKTTLAAMFENLLFHPDLRVIRLIGESVNGVVDGYFRSSGLKAMMYATLDHDVSIATHSVNILCLALRFCHYNAYSIENSREIAISALLHDIGKWPIPAEILAAGNRTPDQENIMRCHAVIGGRLLEPCDFISPIIRFGALEHHERLDGSGYPFGITRMSFFGQLVSILDAYDCIMLQAKNDGKRFNAYSTFSLIKQDVENGRFSREIFQQFAHSLT